MFTAFKWAYSKAGAFALACPALFLLPAAVELLQHAAEIRIGFYDSPAQMRATADSFARMGLGHLKELALLSFLYFTTRFIGFGDAGAAACRWDPRAIRLFSIVALWNIFWVVVALNGSAGLQWLGVPSNVAGLCLGITIFAVTVFGLGLCAWSVAAALGSTAIGFRRSLIITSGSWLWSLALTITVILPPMTLHYLFAGVAIGRPKWFVWSILTVDAPLAAYLGVLSATVGYAITLRVTSRHSVSLAPPP